MPVASAISMHSVQTSHHPATKGIDGRGQHANGSGSESAPNFGEVLRGQAGGALSGAAAKQSDIPVSGQVAEKASSKAAGEISEQTTAAGQIKEAVKAKAAAQMDSPPAQLQALSKGGAQALDADNVQAATANAAQSQPLEKGEKDAKLSLPGADAGDGKAVKDKSGKDGKSNKADKADKIIAEKPPQVPIQAASLAAAAPVSVSVLPALREKATAESVLPCAASATAPETKAASGKQVPQAKAAAAGKTQAPNGVALPMPDASPAPEGAQDAAGDLTAGTDLAEFPSMKSAGKQDADAITAKAGSDVVPQTRHLNSPVPTAVHSAQVAPAAVGGTGETAVHIPTSQQNFAGVAGPALSAAHGAPVSGASPYDRIDQGTAPVLLHSGTQQVAVGVHDPSLGWVEINTQNTAGHIDATLVASSGQTHDALAAQLPAISQFLEQRDVRVGTLVVNHQSAGSAANHFGNGSGQHAGPGHGGYGGNGGSGGNSGGERRGPQYNAPIPARHSVPVTGAGGESSAPARPLSYISVRA